VVLNPTAFEFDEDRRFPIRQLSPLAELFKNAGLQEVEVRPIDIPTHFAISTIIGRRSWQLILPLRSFVLTSESKT
jgi:hypothetical protein